VELFEFLMILISIVLGLGVTEVLAGLGRLLRARASVRWYWIHVFFQLGIFLAILQLWWESWSFRLISEVTFPQSVILLLGPIMVFLIAHLLYPESGSGADLREYYFEQHALLWGLVVLGTVIGTFVRPPAFGDRIFELDNASGLVIIPLGLGLASTRSERFHAIAAPAILIVVLLDTVLPGYLIGR
jgi:hypothetical protein